MIRLEGLKKVFVTGDIETTALNDIDLEVKPGEFMSVVGPSGCGKSTLLNILGLLDSPSAGEYYFMDHEISGAGERGRANLRKRNIGFVFQSFNLIDELTIQENTELPLLYMGMSSAERSRVVGEVLEKLNVAARRKHYPSHLSGGQQQRVAVARAIVGKPKLILADEPTGNLDSVNGEEIMKLLLGLNNEGTTIVMVTHSQEYARWAHRTIHLLDGRVITDEQEGGPRV